jgi:hypothetical protein
LENKRVEQVLPRRVEGGSPNNVYTCKQSKNNKIKERKKKGIHDNLFMATEVTENALQLPLMRPETNNRIAFLPWHDKARSFPLGICKLSK